MQGHIALIKYPKPETIMAASLLLQFLFLALTLLSISQAAQHDGVVDYWKSFYPAIPIPSFVSQHISQMNNEEIGTVVSLIHKKTLASNVTLFCKTAGLVCSTDEIPKDILASMALCYKCYIRYKETESEHMPSTIITEETLKAFFRETSFKKGALFNMGEIKKIQTPATTFLPDSIASLLTLEQSGAVFQNTSVRDMMRLAISWCNSHTPHEIVKCPSSVEELVEFSAEVFSDKRVKVLYPKTADGEHTTVLLDNIRPVLRENPDAKLIACHKLFFPYTVMYCHATSDVQVYQVDLVDPKTRKTINAGMVAVCHRNTKYWSPNHVAFSALRTHPGEGTICHWSTTETLAFVHLDDTLAR